MTINNKLKFVQSDEKGCLAEILAENDGLESEARSVSAVATQKQIETQGALFKSPETKKKETIKKYTSNKLADEQLADVPKVQCPVGHVCYDRGNKASKPNVYLPNLEEEEKRAVRERRLAIGIPAAIIATVLGIGAGISYLLYDASNYDINSEERAVLKNNESATTQPAKDKNSYDPNLTLSEVSGKR